MAELTVTGNKDHGCMDLPPGFRFHPTDQEIIIHYLLAKVLNPSFTSVAITEVNLNKCEPWDLPCKAKIGELEWYFFFQRGRKYPTGMRTNRATESGYWKATGKDKEIYKEGSVLVGMKKTLVFYMGRAPKGEKTNWVMHEFRLEGNPHSHHISKSTKDSWVVCRVAYRNLNMKKNPMNEVTCMRSCDNDLMTEASSLFEEEGLDFKEDSTKIGMMDQANPSIVLMQPPHDQCLSNSCFANSGTFGCMHQDQTGLRASAAASVAPSNHVGVHCKVEQLFDQSMTTTSQLVMLSSETNSEIPKMIQENLDNNIQFFDYLDGTFEDLDNIWNY